LSWYRKRSIDKKIDSPVFRSISKIEVLIITTPGESEEENSGLNPRNPDLPEDETYSFEKNTWKFFIIFFLKRRDYSFFSREKFLFVVISQSIHQRRMI